MKSIYAFILGAILMIGASPAYATVLGWDLSGGVFKPLQNAWTAEVKVSHVTASSSATSTLPTLTTSKAQISTLTSQNCLGTNSSGLIIAGVCSGSSPVYLASSTGYTIGGVAFATGNGTLSTVATGTLTTTATGTQLSATRALTGGPAIFSWSTGYDAVLAASTTQWKGFYDTPSSRITAGTGLSWSGNTLSATGTVNSGTTGQIAYYAGTGTAVSGTSTILIGTGNTVAINGTTTTAGLSIASLSGFLKATAGKVAAALIDLASNITGVLGIANGGLGAAFTDPNADQVMFWDDSAAKITGIVSMVGAAISGTTLTINDVTCTDCLTSTEIADEYLFNTGDVGTGIYDFGGATSIEIVNAPAPTVDAIGEIAIDTTDNQLLIGTSTDAAAPMVIPGTVRMGAFSISSTSQPFTTGFVTGKSISFPTNRDGYKVTELYCTAIGGTSVVINFNNGSGNTTTLTCTTAGASLIGVGANSVVTAGATTTAIETGTVTGAVDYLKVSVYGTYLRE